MEIKIVKKNGNAVLPTKANDTDIGYDLTILEKVKTLTENTDLWDTGLMVVPPEGYYIEILPRSSLSKSGYMLANSVGVIDPDYRGNLMIALKNTGNSTQDIQLPWRCCQMILRKYHPSVIKEYTSEEIDQDTVRGSGNFGSSG